MKAGLLSVPVSDSVAEWERALVARIQAGDDAALAVAYDQFGSLVFGVATRLVGRDQAADITQEVFATLWDRPGRFDPSRGSLRTFLVVLTRRRAIDLLRRSGRRVANEQRAHTGAPVAVPNVDESALAMITGERLRDALTRLPVEQRTAVELAYFGGLTFRQVAAATAASEGTAKSRIRLGLQRLSDMMRLHGEVEPA